MAKSTIIGIDPGKSGGIAWKNPNDLVEVSKMPETLADLADLFLHIQDSANGNHIWAYLEQVHAGVFQGGRTMGVKSAFSFGQNFGHLEMALSALRIAFVRTRPIEWQTKMKCKTGGDKNISKRRAQEMLPHLKITHSTADASLICLYGVDMQK
jgi:hypothetical protein